MKKLILRIAIGLSVFLMTFITFREIYFFPHQISKTDLNKINLSVKFIEGRSFIDGNVYNNTDGILTEITIRTPSPNPFLKGIDSNQLDYKVPIYVKPKTVGSFTLKLFEPYPVKQFIDVTEFRIVDGKLKKVLKIFGYDF